MRKKKDYQSYLIQSLENPKEACAYLNAALEDGNPQIFLLALRNVAEALGGMTKLSKKVKVHRPNLYRILSKKGNPEFASLGNMLNVLGFRLAVQLAKKVA